VGDGERYSFPIIGQRIHFGTQLPSLTNPSETAVQAGIDFAYKPLQGVLESIGPRKISEGIIDKNFALGQHVPGRDVAEGFRKLIAPDQDIEFVRSSRAFLPNSGILGKVLSDVVLDPSSGIDMSRVMVHSLSLYAGDICRLYGDNLDGSYEVNIQPIAIHNMAKGQLLEAVMKMWLPHDRLMSYANIKLFVRGNLSRENVQEDAFVHARDSADMDGTVNFIAMNNLRGFASINGDFNPLHLVNAVGYAADIPQGVINPGFGTIAQIEAALRTAMDGLPLSNIRARFIKPVLPSKEYEIRHWRDGHYQVFEAGSSSDKVIVDGAFVALGD